MLAVMVVGIMAAPKAAFAAISPEEMVSVGKCPEGLSVIASKIAALEDAGQKWTAKSPRGCLGFFQLCGDTYNKLIGRGMCPSVSREAFLNSPEAQVKCWIQYARDNWHSGGSKQFADAEKNYACAYGPGGKMGTTKGAGKKTADCVHITPSAVIVGSQFGLGFSAGYIYGKGGQGAFDCCPPGSPIYSDGRCGRDGNGVCDGHFMFSGAQCGDKCDHHLITDREISEADRAYYMPDNDPSGTPVPGSPSPASASAEQKSTPLRIQPVNLPHFGQMIWGQRMHMQATKLMVQKTFNDNVKYKSASGCIRELQGYFDILANVLKGTLSLVTTAILGIISAVAKMVCSYIITGINNLLASVCLPVPDFSVSMSMPSLESKSCDGLSLQNIISVRGGLGGGGSLPSFSLDSAIRRTLRK